jgi:antitoxin (DNA-binding transcriptional repressor) of toxin-antitoxin stability system
VVIAKAGKPYLGLVPHQEARPARKPGRWKGGIRIADGFDETPGDVIDAFEGAHETPVAGCPRVSLLARR